MIGCYARVSTLEQAENGNSISEQQDRMQKYCEALGLKIYDMYVDAGFSGSNTNRPALHRLIKDVKSHKIDKVLVYKLDRLSRSQKDTLTLIDDVFLSNGCEFLSMSENFDTASPFGRAMIGILAVFAQLEREQIKERMAMGREARAKQGLYIGSRFIPIGYDYKDGQLVPNEFEKVQIQKIFNDYANGLSPQSICDDLNRSGYSHKYGKWIPHTVTEVLSNKVLAGYVSYAGHWHQGQHEALIAPDLWEKVERMRDKRHSKFYPNRRKGRVDSYLGGFLCCAQCGDYYSKNTKSHVVNGKKYVYKYYTCNTRSLRGKNLSKCQNKHWKVDDLDNLIFDEIRKLSLSPQIDDLSPSSNESVQFAIKDKINALSVQIERLMELYSVGGIPLDSLREKIETANDQKSALESQLDRIKQENRDSLSKEDALHLAKSFDDVLNGGDFETIRNILESLIDHIDLDGENVTIYWTFS